MVKTVWEIQNTIRNAANPERQIRIEADLNACKVEEIRAVVGDLPLPEKKAAFNAARALELYKAGFSDYKIGDRLGVNRKTVMEWRKRAGLPAHPAHNKWIIRE